MTTIDKPLTSSHHPLAPALRVVAGIVRSVFRRVAATLSAVVNRREVTGMLELDDRALRDIGLVRNDVLGALAEPLYRDPSNVLLCRSMERAGRLTLLARAVERQKPET